MPPQKQNAEQAFFIGMCIDNARAASYTFDRLVITNQNVKGVYQMKLSQAQAGICGRVAAVTGNHHLLSRLVSIGIVAGSRIEVLQNQPKQPVLFYCRDSVIALTKQDCDGIEIE